MERWQEILRFWFGREQGADSGKQRKAWFQKNPEFDAEIRRRFLNDYELAAGGGLGGWKDLPASCLGLIILLDQFSRNMFRGKPQAFAADHLALSAAEHAVAQGFDLQLPPVRRVFVYLPFEHSENLDDQRRCVELMKPFEGDAHLGSFVQYALKHREIIGRFGRFPHRNAVLGRPSTPEEVEFLSQPGSSF